jgi:hypothetical protein
MSVVTVRDRTATFCLAPRNASLTLSMTSLEPLGQRTCQPVSALQRPEERSATGTPLARRLSK